MARSGSIRDDVDELLELADGLRPANVTDSEFSLWRVRLLDLAETRDTDAAIAAAEEIKQQTKSQGWWRILGRIAKVLGSKEGDVSVSLRGILAQIEGMASGPGPSLLEETLQKMDAAAQAIRDHERPEGRALAYELWVKHHDELKDMLAKKKRRPDAS